MTKITKMAASFPFAAACTRRLVSRLPLVGILAIAFAAPPAAGAEPIQLKLSYFGREQSSTYLNGIKPFVNAVNGEGKGLVNIQVYFGGVLGRSQAQQPQLVLDGGADMAFVVPGVTPYRFPDNVLLELPGMFQSPSEGTLAYTRLIARQALRGYGDFYVIGAYTPEPNFIHSRKPTGSLEALKGQKIRANNPMEAQAIEGLGATPTVLEVTRMAQAIRAGAVDGTTMSPTGTLEFGVEQVAPYHYLLRVGTAPLVLVMNRKRFAGLPEQAQLLVAKYAGDWAARRWASAYETSEKQALAQLRADPVQHVITPSQADAAAAQQVYRSLINAWAAEAPRNRELLDALYKELAVVRAAD